MKNILVALVVIGAFAYFALRTTPEQKANIETCQIDATSMSYNIKGWKATFGKDRAGDDAVILLNPTPSMADVMCGFRNNQIVGVWPKLY